MEPMGFLTGKPPGEKLPRPEEHLKSPYLDREFEKAAEVLDKPGDVRMGFGDGTWVRYTTVPKS